MGFGAWYSYPYSVALDTPSKSVVPVRARRAPHTASTCRPNQTPLHARSALDRLSSPTRPLSRSTNAPSGRVTTPSEWTGTFAAAWTRQAMVTSSMKTSEKSKLTTGAGTSSGWLTALMASVTFWAALFTAPSTECVATYMITGNRTSPTMPKMAPPTRTAATQQYQGMSMLSFGASTWASTTSWPPTTAIMILAPTVPVAV